MKTSRSSLQVHKLPEVLCISSSLESDYNENNKQNTVLENTAD